VPQPFSRCALLRCILLACVIASLSSCATTYNVEVPDPPMPLFAKPERPIPGSYALKMVDDDVLVTNTQVMGGECQGYIGPNDFRMRFQRIGQAAFETIFEGKSGAGADRFYVISITPQTRVSRVIHIADGYLATKRRAEVYLGADVTVTPPSGPALQFDVPLKAHVKVSSSSIELCDSSAFILSDAVNEVMGQVYRDINARIIAEFGSS